MLGDPIGPEEYYDELLWQFRELCNCYDAWPVFYDQQLFHHTHKIQIKSATVFTRFRVYNTKNKKSKEDCMSFETDRQLEDEDIAVFGSMCAKAV